MQDLRDGGQSHALTLYRTVHVENGGTEVVRYVVAKSPAQVYEHYNHFPGTTIKVETLRAVSVLQRAIDGYSL